MKPRLVLLFTRDRAFDQLVSEALFAAGAIVLIARSVADALQIVCQRGRELDFALMDFDNSCRGTTLFSAVHTCYERLPHCCHDFGGRRACTLSRLREWRPNLLQKTIVGRGLYSSDCGCDCATSSASRGLTKLSLPINYSLAD
jgi:hypothetical protein